MNLSSTNKFVTFCAVCVPLIVKLPSTITPPLNVAVSLDWLPIVKSPPKSVFNAVAKLLPPAV